MTQINDDANQCLHNKSGSHDSHGVPNINLSNLRVFWTIFYFIFCSSANKLQQNSNASSGEVTVIIPQILTVLLGILHVYI